MNLTPEEILSRNLTLKWTEHQCVGECLVGRESKTVEVEFRSPAATCVSTARLSDPWPELKKTDAQLLDMFIHAHKAEVVQ